MNSSKLCQRHSSDYIVTSRVALIHNLSMIMAQSTSVHAQSQDSILKTFLTHILSKGFGRYHEMYL